MTYAHEAPCPLLGPSDQMAVFIILARVDHLDQSICRFGRGLMGFCVQTEQEYVRGRPCTGRSGLGHRQLFDVAAYRLCRIQDI